MLASPFYFQSEQINPLYISSFAVSFLLKMAFHTGFFSLLSLYRCHSQIHSVPARSVHGLYLLVCLYPSYGGKRLLSTHTESTPPEFDGKNAYDLLGVSECSSFTEIKSSFRKLAKETHPDLAQSPNDSSVAQRFVQILAAYEILSDSEKRAHYDRYLLSQRALVQTQFRKGSVMYKYESHRATMKQMEVVEWLKWYRYAINDILSERRVVVGSGYFNVLERDFYSAIHAAYYGPEIESMDLLPECFEAEERSACETPEVLHFVSGRNLFGMVCIAERVPELSHAYNVKLPPFTSEGSGLCQSNESERTQMEPGVADSGICQMHNNSSDHLISDAYKDLELHVSGRVVAVANRVPPKNYNNGMQNEDSADHIQVYLIPNEDLMSATHRFPKDSVMGVAVISRIPLGTIIGLGTSPEEGSCYVHDNCGMKTHIVMKHRTLLVKHLHWYQIRDEASVCECRCSRARLPPSKFWLFEPRCGLHDIGGWYVETFGRDKKGQNVPSQRFWDGLDTSEQFETRLHPAMYLLALAYRTLDIESAKRRKQAAKYTYAEKISRILSWWKKLV